jgi:hypothetical protein
MKDLNKLLDDITNNDSFKNPLNDVEDVIQQPDTLYSGFPGDLGQFHQLKRPEKAIKRKTGDDLVLDLESKLGAINNLILEHGSKEKMIETVREKLGKSMQELILFVSDIDLELHEDAKNKFEIIKEAYENLGTKLPGYQSKKNKDRKVELTQPQIVLLFHHLQNLGMITKDVPNTTLAVCISEITGFGFKQLRKSLSSVSLFSENVDANFKPSDYSALDLKVESLKQHLKRESIERFK